MSFLEFVCNRLLGPPVSGTSYWNCPFCASSRASLSVRPPKLDPKTGRDLPIKFKCFRCNVFGDEFDLAKLIHPDDTWKRRRLRIDEWQREYDKAAPAQAENLPHRGTGTEAPRRDDPRQVALEWANLNEAQRAVLIAAHRVMRGRKVSFESLSGYCVDFDEWKKDSDKIEELMRADEEEKQSTNGRRRLRPLYRKGDADVQRRV